MIILTKAEVDAVKRFDTAYESLWQDVLAMADRVHLSGGSDRSWALHHLLLGVGNFKAQMPLFPRTLPRSLAREDIVRADTLELPMPDGHLTLQVENPATWREASRRVHGLGVPRTTTVLSALWPGGHVIVDWRALSAAVALAGIRNGWSYTPVNSDGTRRVRVDWKMYLWYRQTTLECASQEGLQPVEVERALYKLGDAMPRVTWDTYASHIEERLVELSA